MYKIAPDLIFLSFVKYVTRHFFKLIGFYCFVIGAEYWLILTGFYESAGLRLDLLPFSLQIFTILAALFYPLACCGLWHEARWGKMLWAGLIILELYFSLFDYYSFILPHYAGYINLFLLLCYIMQRFIFRPHK